jgi:hypothetical protein
MRLTSPRFNWNARLQMTADNSPPMKLGDLGLYVRHVQKALIDLGHPLPKTIAKHSTPTAVSPDGLFGTETKNAVIDFQKKQKAVRSDFAVDGVVGEQTMGVFDQLLRVPVTLPPLLTPGGATDSNANLVQSLISVLNHPKLADVSFSLMGISISRGSYLLVRNALKDGSISAENHFLPSGVEGFYLPRDALHKVTGAILIPANTFVMPFVTARTVAQKANVVHEATHAFCDIRAIGRPGTAPFTRDQSETVAHVAQAAFHRILKGGPQTDSQTKDVTKGLNPVFRKADELAQHVLAKTPLPSTLASELHGLVRQNRRAIGLPNTTDFDGI